MRKTAASSTYAVRNAELRAAVERARLSETATRSQREPPAGRKHEFSQQRALMIARTASGAVFGRRPDRKYHQTSRKFQSF